VPFPRLHDVAPRRKVPCGERKFSKHGTRELRLTEGFQQFFLLVEVGSPPSSNQRTSEPVASGDEHDKVADWPIATGFYATDIGAEQLAALRDTVLRERLENVTVLEGSAGSANLPDGCCDAVFLRDVYHHLTQPEEFAKSVVAALKPGGRLAIIDFEPESGSKIPPASLSTVAATASHRA
jgi:SAM-dependent methyltransferase